MFDDPSTAENGYWTCRRCQRRLNVHVQGDRRNFIHATTADHSPEPVENEALPAALVCDFCFDDQPTTAFPAEDFVLAPTDPLQVSIADWCACDACAGLLVDGDVVWLVLRAVNAFHRRNGLVEGEWTQVAGLLDEAYRTLIRSRTGPPQPIATSEGL